VIHHVGIQELVEGAVVGRGLVLLDEAADDVLGLHGGGPPVVADLRRSIPWRRTPAHR
jgi:hypothetical protein